MATLTTDIEFEPLWTRFGRFWPRLTGAPNEQCGTGPSRAATLALHH